MLSKPVEPVAAAASVGFRGGGILYRCRLLRLLPAPPFKGVCRAQLVQKEAAALTWAGEALIRIPPAVPAPVASPGHLAT